MDVLKFIEEFENEEGMTVFPDFTDAMVADAKEAVAFENRIKELKKERK